MFNSEINLQNKRRKKYSKQIYQNFVFKQICLHLLSNQRLRQTSTEDLWRLFV